MRPGKEREAAKLAASARKPKPKPKLPKWRRVKGPVAGSIKREPGAWLSSYRRCEFKPDDKASERWAYARIMCPTECPVRVFVSLENMSLRIDVCAKSLFLPLALAGSPPDVDFTIRQIRFVAEQAARRKHESKLPVRNK